MGKDVALIWGDGGIKGGFIAAAADRMLEILKREKANIKILMASSASVGNIFYFLSFGDQHPGFEMWTKTLASKEFLKFEGIKSFYDNTRPIYDINYLVDEIFRKQYPLDIEAIKSSPITIFFPVQDVDTGEIVYFTNGSDTQFVRNGKTLRIENIWKYDIYELIKAASAAPFVFDEVVNINGRRFYDASSVEPIALDLPGMSNCITIAIITKPDASLKRFLSYLGLSVYWIFAVRPFKRTRLRIRHYLDYGLKPLRLAGLYRKLRLFDEQGRAVMVAPNNRIGSNFDNTHETLLKNYSEGIAAVDALDQKISTLLNA